MSINLLIGGKVMVYEIESVEMAPGKSREAREWAKAHERLVEEKFGVTGHMTEPMTPGAGQGGRLIFITTYDSLSTWAETREKRSEDAGWQEHVKTFPDFFIPSSFVRSIYRAI